MKKRRVFYISDKWKCGRVDSNHHGIATASPSSWCVCQFRHDRPATKTAVFQRPAQTGTQKLRKNSPQNRLIAHNAKVAIDLPATAVSAQASPARPVRQALPEPAQEHSPESLDPLEPPACRSAC